MSLRRLLQELLSAADASGESRRAELAGGAGVQIRAKITETDGRPVRRRQLIISRAGVPPSETEIATFAQHGRLPPDAARSDYRKAGDPATYVVTLTWEIGFMELPQAELPL